MTKLVKTEFSALDFVDLADKDYITARLLTFAGKPLWRVAAYHSHQASNVASCVSYDSLAIAVVISLRSGRASLRT